MLNKKPTSFILVALVLGVATGYFYNGWVIKPSNAKTDSLRITINAIDVRLHSITDTAGSGYQALLRQRKITWARITSIESVRDKKLEGFSFLSDIFLRLIKMLVVPLVFTSLVAGIGRMDGLNSAGRIAGKTLLWFFWATLVSLLLGMLSVDFFKPGAGMQINNIVGPVNMAVKSSPSVQDFIDHLLAKSFVAALAGDQILQVVVIAVFFGAGLALLGGGREPLVQFFEVLVRIFIKITSYVMLLAPLAVFGAVTVVVAKQGVGILKVYSAFASEFYLSLIALWLIIAVAGYAVLGKRVLGLISRIKDAMLTAFGTSTSEAAYPKLFAELEQFGCRKDIVSFVLPLGYSFNLDGGMMYMTFASLFIAQAYGVHLSIVQQLTMLFMLMLASKGVAGVPRAALVVVAATLPQFNIPLAGLALIIGIDPLLDMGRSATNVLGNAVATAVVDKWEAAKINVR